MVWALTVVFLVVGCTDDGAKPDVRILVDAAIDTVITSDACVREASGDCCALLPNEDAARECAIATVPPDTCGLLVCWRSDCSETRVNFCAP